MNAPTENERLSAERTEVEHRLSDALVALERMREAAFDVANDPLTPPDVALEIKRRVLGVG